MIRFYPEILSKSNENSKAIVEKIIRNKLIKVLVEIFDKQEIIENGFYSFVKEYFYGGTYESVFISILNREHVKTVIDKIDENFKILFSRICTNVYNNAMSVALDKVDDLFEQMKDINIDSLISGCNSKITAKAANVLYPNLSIQRKASFIYYLSNFKYTNIIRTKLSDDDIVAVMSDNSGAYCRGDYYCNISLTLSNLLTTCKNEDIIIELLDKPGILETMTKQGEYKTNEGTYDRPEWVTHSTSALTKACDKNLSKVVAKYNELKKQQTIKKTKKSAPRLMLIAKYYGDESFEGYHDLDMLVDAIKKTEDLYAKFNGKTAIQIAMKNDNEEVIFEIVKERRNQLSV